MSSSDRTRDPNRQLTSAIDQDDRSTIESLIDAGIDPDEPLEGWNQTPLTRACADDRRSAVEALVEKGADVDRPGARGTLPLHEALKRGAVEIVHYLLDKGANPHAPGEHGQSSLHAACVGGLDDALERLLSLGVDPRVLDSGGQSALHVAAGRRNPRCIELLLRAGVDPNQRDARGETAAWHALENTTQPAHDAIFESGVTLDLRSHRGKSPHHGFMLDTVRTTGDFPLFLARSGLGVNTVVEGESLWTTALRVASPRRMYELLDQPGVDPSQTRADGFSLCHYAARHDEQELFVRAVDGGCDPLAETTGGLAPFQLLVGRPDRGGLWDLLCQRGWASFRSSRRTPQPLNWRVGEDGPHWFFELSCNEDDSPPPSHGRIDEPSADLAATTPVRRDGVLKIMGLWGGGADIQAERSAIEQMRRQLGHVEPTWVIHYGGEGYPGGVVARGTQWETLWLYLGYPEALGS